MAPLQSMTADELAKFLDCSNVQIFKLAERDIVVRLERGRYDLVESTRRYIRHLRDAAAGRGGETGTAINLEYKTVATELARLRLQREANELISIDLARETWGLCMRHIRQFVLGLPGQISFILPTLTLHDRRQVECLCRDGLEDASLGRGLLDNVAKLERKYQKEDVPAPQPTRRKPRAT